MSLLKQIVKSGIAAAAIGISGACSTAKYLDSSQFLSDHSMKSVSSDRDARYSLDVVAMAGKEYLVKNAIIKRQNEADKVFYPLENSWLNQDLNKEKIDLERNTIFVPIQWDGNGDGIPEDEMKFAVSGLYQVKANVKPKNLDSLLSTRTITQEDLPYNIKTVQISKDDKSIFYVGAILDENNRVKDTLIVPVEGSRVLVNTSTGQIRVVNPGKIYILTEKPIEVYRQERDAYRQELMVAIAERDAENAKKAKEEAEKAKLLEEAQKTNGTIPAIEVPEKVVIPVPSKEESPKK
ncbi:hypothetical protein J4423_02860 [Candidatus Pacearchaeota archaeon]|nr:hypothetical protein [Candidatus Pacearchaeota archaeon]